MAISQALHDAQKRAADRATVQGTTIKNAYTTGVTAPVQSAPLQTSVPLQTTVPQNTAMPAQQVAQPVQQMQAPIQPTTDQLFSGIVSGQYTPDKTNAQWTGMYQNGQATQSQKEAYTRWTQANALVDQIKAGNLAPSQTNAAWTALYQNGQPTQAQKDAYSIWDTSVKNGTAQVNSLGIPTTMNSIGSVPTSNSSINVGNLSNANQGYVDLKNMLGASVNGDGLLNGIDSQQAGLLALLGSSSEADKQQEKIQTDLTTAMQSLGMEGQDLQAAYDANGVNANYDKVKQLNLEAAQLQGQIEKFDAETLQGQETIGQQPIANTFVTGQQAAYNKQRALTKLANTAELSSVIALSQAYNGNAELGMKLAEKSVDLKYMPILNQIDILKTQLGYATANATKKDAARADVIKSLLANKEQQVAQQKADDATIQKLAIEAAGNGAPLSVVNQIKSAGDPATAASYASGYIQGTASKFQTVADGSALVDNNGNLIYSNEKDAATGSDPNRVLSRADAEALGVPYGTTSGEAYGRNPGKTLSAADAKVLAIAQTIGPEIQQIKDAFTKDYKGAVLGITTGTNRELVKLVDQVADKVGRLRSGGAINVDEANRFKAQIASAGDLLFGNSQDAINALDGLVAETNVVKTQLENKAPSGSDSVNDPLGIRPIGANDPLGLGREGSGSNAQKILGNAVPTTFALAIAKRYPTGADGGQCTTFLHKIAKFPPVGDWLSEKRKSVDKFGIPKAQWTPKLGDIVVTNDDPNYGHTFQINALLGNGKAQVTESNWKGNEKVTHSRIVDLNSPSIYGAIRPGLTSQEA